MKVALIIGITGQDGSWLAELLLEKQYEVHGIIRRSSNFNTQRIDHIFNRLKLHYGDLTDTMSIYNTIAKIQPDEIYNFGAQSHVKVSSELENYTFHTNTMGVLNILQSVKSLGLEKKTKIYQASTSEQFGNETDGTTKLNEESLQKPVSVYGVSKVAAQQLCNIYRDAHSMFVVASILFNHEGERRGNSFVTQKISNYVADYNLTLLENQTIPPLQLGNLNARRDWGNAKDYVKAIWLMMQQEKPQNFVIATGETHSVREFVTLAFKHIGIPVKFKGEGKEEVGINTLNNQIVVQVNENYYRDIDIECLIGDASKAENILGWKPETSFEQLIKNMVTHSIKRKIMKK